MLCLWILVSAGQPAAVSKCRIAQNKMRRPSPQIVPLSSSSFLLEVAGGGERQEVPDLEWATQEFAPVIKRGINIPVASHNRVPHTPRTPSWFGRRSLCSGVVTMLVVGNFPLSLWTWFTLEWPFPFLSSGHGSQVGRFSSGEDTEAILWGHCVPDRIMRRSFLIVRVPEP